MCSIAITMFHPWLPILDSIPTVDLILDPTVRAKSHRNVSIACIFVLPPIALLRLDLDHPRVQIGRSKITPPYFFSPLSFACSAPISTVTYFYPTATLLPRHLKQFKPISTGFLNRFVFCRYFNGFPLCYEERPKAGRDVFCAFELLNRTIRRFESNDLSAFHERW